MIGHKVVPSTKGGIETALTNLCPIIAGYGHEVTCYNRSSDKSEDVFAGDINHGRYKGVVLKKGADFKTKGNIGDAGFLYGSRKMLVFKV